MGHPINDRIDDSTASAPLAERIQQCLQSKHTLDYILVTKLALDEGEPELARKLAQEGIEYYHSRALFDDDDPWGFRFITLYELVGEFNLAQKYCESYHQYEKGGDLALKLGQPDEARRWWARQIEFNESEDLSRRLPGLYLGKNVLLAKKIGDESLAQKFYDKLVSYTDTRNEAGNPQAAEVMGDSRHAVRWYQASGDLGNAARVAMHSADHNYRGIMEEIVEKFDGELRWMFPIGGVFYPQVEAPEDFWKELLTTTIAHYRRKDCWDIAGKINAQKEKLVLPRKGNVYEVMKGWMKELNLFQ